MGNLNVTVGHRLGQEEAARRIKGILSEVKSQFADKIGNLCEEWYGDTGKFSFTFLGFAVSGTLTVTPAEVNIAGTLPLAGMMFKKEFESTIRTRAETLLA